MSKLSLLMASLTLTLGGCAAVPGGLAEAYYSPPVVIHGGGYPIQVPANPAYYGGSPYYGGTGKYSPGVMHPSHGHRPAATVYVPPRPVLAPPRTVAPPTPVYTPRNPAMPSFRPQATDPRGHASTGAQRHPPARTHRGSGFNPA